MTENISGGLEMPKTRLMDLSVAVGKIEPRDDQYERFDELVEDVRSGNYHKSTDKVVICKCIDGRRYKHHGIDGPNSAGGTLSMVITDDLTKKRFANGGDSLCSAAAEVSTYLQENGYSVGCHTDSHATDEISGCGANDKLADIYMNLCRFEDDIKAYGVQILGHTSADSLNNRIFNNALEREVFDTGKKLHDTAVAQSQSPNQTEQLEGEHNEVIVVINMRQGMTLDRDKLAEKYSNQYQAFNVDTWAFEPTAKVLLGEAATEDEVQEAVLALTYFNLAAALTLCGPNMRVIVME